MKLLAVETSTLMGSVAVVDGERTLCELTLRVEETHSSQLMPAIDYVLKTLGLGPRQLDGFAIALGPGSFTGLRIGMSTVKGLATATSKPIVGVPTLEAMAWDFPFCPHLICPLIDARMKEVYAAWFRAKEGAVLRQSEDLVLPPSVLLEGVKEETLFFGSGAQRYREEIREAMGDLARFASPEIMGARASIIGMLAAQKMDRNEISDTNSLEPLYIRESQAHIKARARSADS
jgi:tRNA threonylcarbamoyladenosine biosynthesis protein TsaB